MQCICSSNGNGIDSSQEARSFANSSESDHLPEDPQSIRRKAFEHPKAFSLDHEQPSF
jgi:hypothetical protein